MAVFCLTSMCCVLRDRKRRNGPFISIEFYQALLYMILIEFFFSTVKSFFSDKYFPTLAKIVTATGELESQLVH